MVYEEKLKAFLGTFIWVATSDGDFSLLERLNAQKIFEQLSIPVNISNSDDKRVYLEMIEAFKKDFNFGRNLTIKHIEGFRGDRTGSEQLIKLARLTMMADEQIKDQEEGAIAEISKLLDIDESSLH